jgi:hypothetical protein
MHMTGSIRHRIPSGRLRLLGSLIAALAAVTFMVVPATMAQAATTSSPAKAQPAVIAPLSSPTDCMNMFISGEGRPLCAWVDAGFVGKMMPFFLTNDSWTSFPEATCTLGDANGTWNDCASALFNAGSQIAIVFQNIDRKASDRFQCIAPGTMAYKNLAADNYPQSPNPTMNDSISSNEWTPSGAQCP